MDDGRPRRPFFCCSSCWRWGDLFNFVNTLSLWAVDVANWFANWFKYCSKDREPDKVIS